MADTLLAYHSDPALKRKIMRQVRAHRAADEIAQGAYYAANGKVRVCAVGCVLHDPDGGHIRYEDEFGIPVQLAWLADGIFEALPLEAAKEWPERFMGAIKSGADLTAVWPRFAAWMLIDEQWGVASTTDAEDVKDVCRRVASAYERMASGETISDAEADEIARDARAAWDAWDAWDARDARAARAAWAAWAARAARAAFVAASADKLIALLNAAPRPSTEGGEDAVTEQERLDIERQTRDRMMADLASGNVLIHGMKLDTIIAGIRNLDQLGSRSTTEQRIREFVRLRAAEKVVEAAEAVYPWTDTYEDHMGAEDFDRRDRDRQAFEKALADFKALPDESERTP